MTERAALFGPTRSLMGIVTEPVRAHGATIDCAVILITAGLIHRVGPNRLYVKIARTLAASGFGALRFDLSGIGDSNPRQDDVQMDQRAIVETKEAMEHLSETRGAKRFVLIGLCSGADDAFLTALVDTRVVGIVLIDPCLYSSLGFLLSSYSRRLFSLKSWISLLTGRSDLWKLVRETVRRRSAATATDLVSDWKEIPADRFRTGLLELADRDVRILLVYSPGNSAFHNYKVGVQRKLGNAGRPPALQVECVDGADHTFTRLRHQEALLDVIREWARVHLP